MDTNQRIREVFDAAIDLPRERRQAYLRDACAGHEALFQEVARLVRAYESSVEDDDEVPAPEIATPLIGRVVDAYEIVGELGSGGMGSVYLARRVDGTFEREVAFKVIRADRMTPGALERFVRERRLLAALTHPGIARLLDAGATPDGLPYFVMEYVDGLPVTDYCDRHRLSIRDRLLLFRRVCDAVASAHRVPIVHCDLKPGNIMVDADGHPRVLDFGIATALTRGGRETEPPLDPYGSPRYASPEQLRGEPVQTTSDVYSLGVVLHELLVGAAPLPGDGDGSPPPPSSLLRESGETTAIAVERPSEVAARRGTTPAALRASLSGDLDAVIAACLRPQPAGRYQSVEALSEDIQRHLDGRPVSVRPQTLRYVGSRFVARHRLAVAAATTVLLLLAGAAVLMAVLWQKAARERVRAEQRFTDVRALALSLFEIDASLADTAGTTDARQRIISSATRYLDRLSRDAPVDGALALEIAESYRRLGDMLGNPNAPNLGRRDEAMRMYDTASQRIAAALAAGAPDGAARLVGARIDAGRADVLFAQGRFGEARESYERAAGTLRPLLVADAGSVELQQALAGIYRPLGDVWLADGEPQRALEHYDKARGLDLAVLTRKPGDPEATRLLALSQLRAADALAAVGRRAEAVEGYGEALRILDGLPEDAGVRARTRRDAALARLRLGLLAHADGSPRGRIEMQEAIVTFRELAARDPLDAAAQRDLLVGLVRYADAIRAADASLARSLYVEARRLGDRLGAEPVRDALGDRDLAAVAARLERPAPLPEGVLRIDVVRDGRQVPVDRETRAPAIGEELHVSWPADRSRAQYLLLLGGAGPPTLMTRAQVATAGWRVKTSGPLPSQTLLVLDLEKALSAGERETLVERLARVGSPRALAPEVRIAWPAGQLEMVDTRFRARGEIPDWASRLREELGRVPGLRYSGLTFPLDGFR